LDTVLSKKHFLERDFSGSIFDEKAPEVQGELSCAERQQIGKPVPFISSNWLSHLTPTFGTFFFSLHMQQRQIMTPHKFLGAKTAVLGAAVLFPQQKSLCV